MSDAQPEIRHSVFIRAPREKVWTAFTTPKGLDGWWGTRGSEIDLRPGGKLTLRWRGWGAEQDINADADCVIVEVLPPTRFVNAQHHVDLDGSPVRFEGVAEGPPTRG